MVYKLTEIVFNILQNPSYLKPICCSGEAIIFLRRHMHGQNVKIVNFLVKLPQIVPQIVSRNTG